jgi:hypothetical protein
MGCSNKPPTVISNTSLGQILSADAVYSPYGERVSLCVKTEIAVVVINSATRVDLGKEAFSIQWSDGHRSFEWEGSKFGYNY